MAEIRRRIRKRGEKKQDYFESIEQEQQQQEIVIKQETSEEEPDNFMSRGQLTKAKDKLQIKQAIDEMKADIIDERKQELDEIQEEGLFDSEVSDDYWYFLSLYE